MIPRSVAGLVVATTFAIACAPDIAVDPRMAAPTPAPTVATIPAPVLASPVPVPPPPRRVQVEPAAPSHDTVEDEPDPLLGITPRHLGTDEVRILIDALPLQRNDIDFGRIRNFFNLYVAILAGEPPERRTGFVAAIRQARIYMREGSRLTANNMSNFQIEGLTANDLIAWARPPQSGSAVPLADALKLIVRQVYQVVQDFRKYADFDPSTKVMFDEEMLNAIEQQVGGKSIPYGSSLVYANLSDIANARERLAEFLKNPQ